jgi:hypothetical protein
MAGGGYTGGSTVIRIGPNGTLWPTYDGPNMGRPRNAEVRAKVKAKAREEARKRQNPARKRGRGNNAAGKRAGKGAAATKAKVVKGLPIQRASTQEFEVTLEVALLAANKNPEGIASTSNSKGQSR